MAVGVRQAAAEQCAVGFAFAVAATLPTVAVQAAACCARVRRASLPLARGGQFVRCASLRGGASWSAVRLGLLRLRRGTRQPRAGGLALAAADDVPSSAASGGAWRRRERHGRPTGGRLSPARPRSRRAAAAHAAAHSSDGPHSRARKRGRGRHGNDTSAFSRLLLYAAQLCTLYDTRHTHTT